MRKKTTLDYPQPWRRLAGREGERGVTLITGARPNAHTEAPGRNWAHKQMDCKRAARRETRREKTFSSFFFFFFFRQPRAASFYRLRETWRSHRNRRRESPPLYWLAPGQLLSLLGASSKAGKLNEGRASHAIDNLNVMLLLGLARRSCKLSHFIAARSPLGASLFVSSADSNNNNNNKRLHEPIRCLSSATADNSYMSWQEAR